MGRVAAESLPLILHVSTVPESFGFLHGQIGHMRRAGFRVALVASEGPYAAITREREGVPVYAVAMERRITPLRDVRAVLQLVWLMRRLRPTIVHAHTPKGGLLGMVAARLARCPVRVYHMRGLPLETATGAKRALLSAAERVSCALADRVVCVSSSLHDLAVRQGLVPAGRAIVLASGSGNGVDWDGRFAPRGDDESLRRRTRGELGIAPDAPVLAFFGRVVADKGVTELAGAWARVRETHARAVLLIVGPEEATDPVAPRAMQALRADPRVIFTGIVRDTRPLLIATDVLVLPTYREGFPNVLLEAAALRIPVVATRVTGCVDAVVDGVTGLLVEPRDAKSLADALMRYLDDALLAAAHGAAARERVIRQFDPPRIWRALEGLYRDLMMSKRGLLAVASRDPALANEQ